MIEVSRLWWLDSQQMEIDVIDLKKHAWRYRFNGFPIYGEWEDGEENDVIGVVVEPLWQWADLSAADKATVRELEATYRADERSSDLGDDMVFWLALCEFGIACPHLRWEYHEPVWRECKACRTIEQLPGRVVYINDKPLRVSDPPPRHLRIPRPLLPVSFINLDLTDPTAPAMECDEYEWVGGRHGDYRKISR